MPDESVADQLVRLRDLEFEYDTTLRVLAAVVEMVQKLTGKTEVIVTDADLVDDPSDLTAWRDAGAPFITLKTAR